MRIGTTAQFVGGVDKEEEMYKELFNGLLDGTIENVESDAVISIRKNALTNCAYVKRLDLPNATSVPASLLYNCTSLQYVNLPKVTSLPPGLVYSTGSSINVEMHFDGVTNLDAGTNNRFGQVWKADIYMPNATSLSGVIFYAGGFINVFVPKISSTALMAMSGFPFHNTNTKWGYWHCSDGLLKHNGTEWVVTEE